MAVDIKYQILCQPAFALIGRSHMKIIKYTGVIHPDYTSPTAENSTRASDPCVWCDSTCCCTGCRDYNDPYSTNIYYSPEPQYITPPTDYKELIHKQNLLDRISEHKAWWFESFHKKPILYNAYRSKSSLFRKILLCNRRGIGLRLKFNR